MGGGVGEPVGPGDGFVEVRSGVRTKIGETTVVFFTNFDDRMTEFVPTEC